MRIMKKILIAIFTTFIFIFPSISFAANPQFSIRPGSGNVIRNKNFTVDILIDSKNNDIASARIALEYDPDVLQIVKAQRNSSIFCSYPEVEQNIDNENGVLVMYGFCQSGTDEPYRTVGEADVFARVTFKALKNGTANINWSYTGTDVPTATVIMKDGSPPQNLLASKPTDASFKVVSGTTTPKPPSIPNTGLAVSSGLIIGGIAAMGLGFGYNSLKKRFSSNKLRTVIVHGKKK